MGLGTLALLLLSSVANAYLGGTTDTVESDAQSLGAALNASNTTTNSAYTVRTMNVHGTLIREYISSAGSVFGVAWSGKKHPNFRALLGEYTSEFDSGLKDEASSKKMRRGVPGHFIQTDHLVAKYSGHPGHMTGQAYVPDLIPQGVTPDEIK